MPPARFDFGRQYGGGSASQRLQPPINLGIPTEPRVRQQLAHFDFRMPWAFAAQRLAEALEVVGLTPQREA
jgi:hypothetical protein